MVEVAAVERIASARAMIDEIFRDAKKILIFLPDFDFIRKYVGSVNDHNLHA
jgi:hypothetical protein